VTLLLYTPADPVADQRVTRRLADRWHIPASCRVLLKKPVHRLLNYCERELAVKTVADFLTSRL